LHRLHRLIKTINYWAPPLQPGPARLLAVRRPKRLPVGYARSLLRFDSIRDFQSSGLLNLRNLRNLRMMQNDPRTFAIIGAAMEVHRQLGCGFLEPVYQEALASELAARGVPHRGEVELPVHYKGQRLNTSYRADFLCYDTVIVELKALAKLSGMGEAQILNYLKASGCGTGLLLNFGAPSLEYKRLIWSSQSRDTVATLEKKVAE